MVISTALQKQETGIKLSPLSFNQQRVWFLEQLVPKSPFYNLAAAYQLVGRLDVVRLLQSLNEIVRRHESLRTTFALVEEQPVQVIHPTLRLPLPAIELAELPEKERAATVSRLMTQEAQKPFDLLQGPLLRSTLLCLGSHEHLLLLTMHHIISDESSLEVLIKELAALYQAVSVPGGAESPCPQPELPIQYADFALWQRKWQQSEVLKSHLTYWSQQLDGIPTILELPTDRSRSPIQTWKAATYSFVLPTSLCESLKKFSQLSDVTLFMMLLAAFKVLLYRYSRQNDIVVGTPVANRNRAELEGLIGFFVNSLVLRTKLSSQMSFRELLAQVREVCLGAYAHQELPFEKLVEQLQPERDLSHNPLFQVMFTLHDAPLPPLRLSSDLTISHFPLESGIVRLDLELHFWEISEGLKGQFKYNTALFDTTTVMRMVGHFQTSLQAYVLNSGQRLSDLPLLTEPERELLLVEWNKTQADYPFKLCIHQLFESQVARTPNAIAAVFAGHDKDHQLTYRELNQRANQLARYLQSLGVGSEVLVGICLERSLDMLIGLLGILKAGGAYVPLDPAYPKERLAFMLQDAELVVLVTQKYLAEELPKHTAQVVCLDSDWTVIAQENTENPISQATADNLAYVIYTSGSTGIPKGVLGLHRGALNRFSWMWLSYPFRTGEVCCQKTSLNFVDSVWEIFGSLLQGVPIVIIPDQMVKDSAQLIQTLAKHHVTRIVLVPSLLRVLLESDSNLQKRLLKLQVWVSSGEALSADIVKRFRRIMPSRVLLNLYGSSEVSADVTWYDTSVDNTDLISVPIGRPICNTFLYILDRQLQPVPVGVLGELYVGGENLARGYLNRPKLTADRFIPNPFGTKPGTRMYKTGDLARYLPNGNLEFGGRIDHQVKIRGFRIELGEIETVLEQHPAIKESIVVVRENKQDKQLVAYVIRDSHYTGSQKPKATWREGQTYNNNSCQEKLNHRLVSEWRRFLQGKLPHYMVPTAFVLLDALPLTPNGKVNRRALPAPSQAKLELDETFVAPSTPVEELLAGIWLELLDLEQVGIYHNFFNLGGHSLTATQFISRVRDYLRVDISLRSLFESPSIAELTTIILKNPSERLEIEKKAQLFLSLSRLSDLEIERMLSEKSLA